MFQCSLIDYFNKYFIEFFLLKEEEEEEGGINGDDGDSNGY
jgi:hypothetical protein